MKKFLLLTALALFCSFPLHADKPLTTTPEQKAAREDARKVLSELKSLIAEAKKQNIDTRRFDAINYVAELGLQTRWLMPMQEDNRLAYCDWAKTAGREGIERLKGIMSGKYKQPAIPEWPDETKLAFKNGRIYNGEEPVVLFGFNGGESTKDYTYQRQLFRNVSAVGGSRFDFKSLPIWEAYQKYPETHRVFGKNFFCGHIISDIWSDMGSGECIICLESPITKKAIQQYWDMRMPTVANDKNIRVVGMGWEWIYVCMCDYTKAMFQDWLKNKHGKIETLNGIWGTNYKDFSEITTIPIKDPEKNDAKWFDYSSFNGYRFAEYMHWAKDEMKKQAPDKLFCTGSPFYYLVGQNGYSGCDGEYMNEVSTDIVLNESGPSTWTTDLLLAFSKGEKIIMDDEYHGDLAHAYAHFLHGDSYMSMWWWPSAPTMQIQSYYSSSLAHSYSIPLEDSYYALTIGMDIRRLSKYIADFPKAQLTAPIALLYSKSSLIQIPEKLRNSRETPYLLELKKCYNALLYQDSFSRFTTEKMIDNGEIKDAKVLVIPGAVNIPESTAKKISEFAENGGTVIVVPNSLMYDEYNRKKDYLKELADVEVFKVTLPKIVVGKAEADSRTKDDGFIQGAISDIELSNVKKVKVNWTNGILAGGKVSYEGLGVVQDIKTGKSAEVLATFEDGKPAIVVNRKGKGKVYYLATSLEKDSLWKFFDLVVKDEKIERLVTIVDKEGKRVNGIESRTLAKDGGYVTYIINLTDKDVTVKLDTKLAFKSVTDMLKEVPADASNISIKKNRTVFRKLE